MNLMGRSVPAAAPAADGESGDIGSGSIGGPLPGSPGKVAARLAAIFGTGAAAPQGSRRFVSAPSTSPVSMPCPVDDAASSSVGPESLLASVANIPLYDSSPGADKCPEWLGEIVPEVDPGGRPFFHYYDLLPLWPSIILTYGVWVTCALCSTS